MKDIYSKFDKNYSWLPANIFYVCQTGSKAYGTNIEGSDDDFKAISFGRIQDYFGTRDSFQQYSLTDPDFTVFEFRKAIKLLADGNPNSIEMLFVDPSDIKVCTKFGERLLAERDLFITKQVKERFLGYARAQLHRTKLHRSFLRNPIESRPKREDFGLPEELTIPKAQFETVSALMKKEIDKWNPDFELFSEAQKIYLQDKVNTYLSELNIYSDNLWQSAARKLGYSENFILLLHKEKEFESAVKSYNNYQEWKKNRNPKRAALEAKVGFDGKHMGHCIRLSYMAVEILETGKVNVRRADREQLLEIRNGLWSYERLEEEFEKLQVQIKLAYDKSSLPKAPNYNKIDDLAINMLEDFFRYNS
jgi:uncharacterized protein